MTEQEIKDLAKAVFDNGTKDLSAQAEKSAAAVERTSTANWMI